MNRPLHPSPNALFGSVTSSRMAREAIDDLLIKYKVLKAPKQVKP